MLVKVTQSSGNVSVYEVEPQWTEASDIKRYGRLIATKFAKDGWMMYQDARRIQVTEGGGGRPPITHTTNDWGPNWNPCDAKTVTQFEALSLCTGSPTVTGF